MSRRGQSYAGAMPCVFCASVGPMSREHVFPRWLSDLLPEFDEAAGFDYERRLVTHRDELAHHRSGPLLDVVTRDVCEVCNNGWLENLETEARPVLTPMIRGTARVLSALEQQFVVASWARKTMLTMHGTNIGRERVASAEQYRWFFEHQQPLPGSHVWLVRYADRTRWPIVAHQYAMSVRRAGEPAPQMGDPLNGFGVVFTVGHLVSACSA